MNLKSILPPTLTLIYILRPCKENTSIVMVMVCVQHRRQKPHQQNVTSLIFNSNVLYLLNLVIEKCCSCFPYFLKLSVPMHPKIRETVFLFIRYNSDSVILHSNQACRFKLIGSSLVDLASALVFWIVVG